MDIRIFILVRFKDNICCMDVWLEQDQKYTVVVFRAHPVTISNLLMYPLLLGGRRQHVAKMVDVGYLINGHDMVHHNGFFLKYLHLIYLKA